MDIAILLYRTKEMRTWGLELNTNLFSVVAWPQEYYELAKHCANNSTENINAEVNVAVDRI